MREPVLGAGILRAVAFTMPRGLPGLLAALVARAARVPAEVYNGDEDARLADDDISLSALAREIRVVRRQAGGWPWANSPWEHVALRRAARLQRHLADGSLRIDALRLTELPRREHLRNRYGLGRGEAASLVLAERHGVAVVYSAAAGLAADAARSEGLRVIAIREAMAA